MAANFWFVRVGDLRFGGTKLFSVLLEVDFGRCKGLGKVLTHQIGGEARPRGENPVVDSLGPVFADRAKISTVQILHKVGLGCHLVGVVCLGHGGKYCWKSLWKVNIVEAVVGVPGDEYCGFLKKNWLESCR